MGLGLGEGLVDLGLARAGREQVGGDDVLVLDPAADDSHGHELSLGGQWGAARAEDRGPGRPVTHDGEPIAAVQGRIDRRRRPGDQPVPAVVGQLDRRRGVPVTDRAQREPLANARGRVGAGLPDLTGIEAHGVGAQSGQSGGVDELEVRWRSEHLRPHRGVVAMAPGGQIHVQGGRGRRRRPAASGERDDQDERE